MSLDKLQDRHLLLLLRLHVVKPDIVCVDKLIWLDAAAFRCKIDSNQKQLFDL
jgi:hypothetical protein